jgi:hypothetical protein
MVTRAAALPGRAAKMAISSKHYVLSNQMEPPYPPQYKKVRAAGGAEGLRVWSICLSVSLSVCLSLCLAVLRWREGGNRDQRERDRQREGGRERGTEKEKENQLASGAKHTELQPTLKGSTAGNGPALVVEKLARL